MENGTFPPNFKTRVAGSESFPDAYCEIERYCEEREVWVPDRLQGNSVLLMEKKSRSRL